MEIKAAIKGSLQSEISFSGQPDSRSANAIGIKLSVR